MKTSWVIGVIMFYLLIFGIEMMVTDGTAFSANETQRLNVLMGPTMTNQSGATSALVSLAKNVGTYFVTFLNAIFPKPTSWERNYVCLT